MQLLCKRHHGLVHARGYIVTRDQAGRFTFTAPDGLTIPPARDLPGSDGDLAAWHDAGITPETIIPPHSGERLDLHLAIWIALNNGRIAQQQEEDLQVAA